MHTLLSKLLNKRGIDNKDSLSLEEKTTFENYEKVLSKKELTIEDVKTFVESQVNIIEAKWKDYDTPNEKKAELIPYHTVYKTLYQVIGSPEVERRTLEQYLLQLIN